MPAAKIWRSASPVAQSTRSSLSTLFPLQVNPDLPFLSSFVAQALAQGHAPYKPAAERQSKKPAAVVEPDASRLESAFRFEAYDAPTEAPATHEGLFAGIGRSSGGPSEAGSVKGGSNPASGASTPTTGRRVVEGRKLNKPGSGLQVQGPQRMNAIARRIVSPNTFPLIAIALTLPLSPGHPKALGPLWRPQQEG